MQEGAKKPALALGIICIVFLSIFVVTTQYQISELNNRDEDRSLYVKILVDETSGVVPFEIKFSSLVTNNKGNVKYQWDFGDGETSEEREPTHIYEGNDSYVCKLTVTSKNGDQSVDTIKISPKNNLAPRVSIEISSTTPERKFKFNPSYLILRSATESMGGKKLYYLRKAGIAPLASEESDIHVSALVSDPEGDEIVSYEWELRPPTITLFGMQPYHPIHIYTGKNVTLGLLDTYVKGKYDLKLNVVDEAGNRDSEIISFEVEENPIESKTFSMANHYKTQWLQQYSGIDPIKTAVAGGIGFLLYRNIISQKVSFPLVKLTFMVFLSSLKLPPEEYGNETMMDVGGQFFDKWEFLKPITKNLFDKFEAFLVKIGENDTAEEFQIIEEQLGLDNKRPELTNPFPEDEKTFVNLDTQKVYITVEDMEGNPFSVQIYDENNIVDNVSGYYPMGQLNGSFSANLNTPLPPNTEITWKVLVIDENDKEVIGNYKFTTHYE